VTPSRISNPIKSDAVFMGTGGGRVLDHGRGRIIKCRLKDGDGIRTSKRFGGAATGKMQYRRALLHSNGNSGGSRETSANAGLKPTASCVLPRTRAQTGRQSGIGWWRNSMARTRPR